jgi:hypothetical protein
MTISQLEQRIATLEQQVHHLADKVEGVPSRGVNGWIDEVQGTFENDAAYRKAARLGRQWRRARARSRKPKSK